MGFKPSKIDPCIFYRKSTIFLLYVDDGIFIVPQSSDIDKEIKELQEIHFDIEDQGEIDYYLGIHFTHQPDKTILLHQPHLIDQIISDLGIPANARRKTTPAPPNSILHRHNQAPSLQSSYNYRSIIGKLNFLEKGTRPDISYAVHQLARFSSDPKIQHGEVLEHLGRYLFHTRNDGLILSPQENKMMEVYADADFSGNWNPLTEESDPSTTKSRTGFIILYAKCPLTWTSNL